MERALIEYLANSAWQLPLLAGGAWLLLRIVRPEPLAQHWIWVLVLATAVMLPLRGMVGSHVAAAPVGAGFAAAPSVIAVVPASLPPRNVARRRGERWTALAAEMEDIHLNATVMQWLMWMYMGAIFLGGLRLLWAWMAARRLVEHSREMVFRGHALESLQQYGRKLGVELPPLRGSSEVLSPVVVGAWKPVLLLPGNFFEHTEEEIQAALCHELAHVRRRDTLANLLCRAMALPLVWHPASYAVQRRIRSTREMVCDAMAAEEMRSEMGYAKCLVALARSMAGGYGSTQTEGLGLFDNNTLEERVMRLTNNKTVMSTRGKIASAAGGAAVMMAAITIAAMFHVTPTLAKSQAASPVTPSRQSASEAPAASSGEGMSTGRGASSSSGEGVSTGKSGSTGLLLSTGESGAGKGELGIPGLAAVAHGKTASISTTPSQGEYFHSWKRADGERFLILNHDRRKPTLEERRRIEERFQEQMSKMNLNMAEVRRQIEKTTSQINSPEFKKQMAEIQKQMQNGELQRSVQMADMQVEMKALKMPDVHLRMKALNAQLNSPEFKKQMAEMQKQMQDGELQRSAQMAAMRAQMKALKLPDIRLEMKDATTQMDSSELEQEMAEVQKAVQRGELQREKVIRILQDAQRQLEKMQTK